MDKNRMRNFHKYSVHIQVFVYMERWWSEVYFSGAQHIYINMIYFYFKIIRKV